MEVVQARVAAPSKGAPVRAAGLHRAWEAPGFLKKKSRTQYKEIWPASTAPLSKLPLASYKLLYISYHIASSCAPRL
jgi:hypothetical protein